MKNKLYTVNEAFEVLKEHEVITNIEVLRRWLRQGKIEGIAPTTRKKGWMITQAVIDKCLADRMPAAAYEKAFNTTPKGDTVALDENAIRTQMWWELVHKNIWEDYVPIKKQYIKEAAEHCKYSNEFVETVWERITLDSDRRGYSKQPRITYLLEAFLFESQRLLLDKKFTSKHEQVVYAIFDYVLKNR